jgi:type II secretory pathway pseudopilin PulG
MDEPTKTTRAARARRASRGYTASEVLISLALLGVGSAGVISMEKGTVLGNAQARDLDTANAIARTWIERLRTDATAWTLPSASSPSTNNISNTKFLVDGTGGSALVDVGRDPTDDGWFLPDQAIAQGMNPAADNLGRDLLSATPANGDIRFCTHVRIQCLVPTQTVAGAATSCSLMRAQVRVFWPRSLVPNPNQTFCAKTNLIGIETNAAQYHFVYEVTALRQNSDQ